MSPRLSLALCGVLALLWLSQGPASAQDAVRGRIASESEKVSQNMSLDDARELARSALINGDHAIAVDLGGQILRLRPDDVDVMLLVATAELERGHFREARKAAARAYRESEDNQIRLNAAQLAASAALYENRLTLSQLWLRRAATNTSAPQDLHRIGADYLRLRRLNPFSFHFRGQIAPSNNVNNGANGSELIIDGVPLTGELSGSAQSLSGIIYVTDAQLKYRIAQSRKGSTTLGTRLYAKRVSLSSEAKRLAPGLKEAELGTTYLDFSVARKILWGTPGNGAGGELSFGRAWAGESHHYDFVKLNGTRFFRLGDRTQLSFSAAVEERNLNRSFGQDQTLFSFAAQLSSQLSWGDRVGLSMTVIDVQTEDVNQRSLSTGVYASYSFAKPWGPVQISASLAVEQAAYKAYQIGWIAVPGGRKDTLLATDLTFHFKDLTYAGFTPALRLRAGRRFSNVSRFESDVISMNFEIRSEF